APACGCSPITPRRSRSVAPSATSTTLPVNSREGARSPVSEAARVRRHRPAPEGRLAGPAPTAPGGEAAVAVHRGPYDRMNEAYTAIEEWMVANRRESAAYARAIYGDPTPDPANTE